MTDALPQNGSSIGVFDSGIGGLSILRELRALTPGAGMLYLADQAYAPYGSRGLREVRRRAVAVTEFLLRRGAGVVVVACNSASAAALHHLRDLYPAVPFVGMEPAVKPAAATSPNGVVGVLATPATFQGALYASVVDRHAAGVRLVEAAPAGLASAVEEGRRVEAEEILRRHVGAMLDAGADTIVLGCTHYPFVADLVAALAGPGVQIVDPSPAVARQVARVAERGGVGKGPTQFLTTGEPAHLADRCRDLLGIEATVERVEL
jgi:glutamate racemase